MHEPPLDVERIVQEVLRRLRDGPAETAGNTAMPQGNTAKTHWNTAKPQVADELVLTERLVTWSVLEGRLEGVRTVRVPARAVVTPAARDYLRAAGASLAALCGAANGEANRGLALGVAEARYDAVPLGQLLEQQGIEVRQTTATDLAAAIDELAAATRGGQPALLLTGEVPAAICLANRLRGVRAAQAGNAAEAARAVVGVGANMLIVDPSGKGLYRLKELVIAFCRPGRRACPAAWRQRLE